MEHSKAVSSDKVVQPVVGKSGIIYIVLLLSLLFINYK